MEGWKEGGLDFESNWRDDLYLRLGAAMLAMLMLDLSLRGVVCPPLHTPIYASIYTPGQFLHACGTDNVMPHIELRLGGFPINVVYLFCFCQAM